MIAEPARAAYSTAAVSKLIGVSCHALRVWERRYGFPIPQRSPSGHRRYAHRDVDVLRSLAGLARPGQSLGRLIGEYRAGTLELREATEAMPGPRLAFAQVVDRLYEGKFASAEAMLDRMAERLTPGELIESVIEPALVDIGERWFLGQGEIFQERCATACLFSRVRRIYDRVRGGNLNPSRSVLIGTVQGDRHEGGVLLASLSLELAGWRAVPMGIDLPVDEFRKAIACWHPDALAVSFVLSRNINKRFQELSKIRDVPVFVGGRSIVNHQGLARRLGLIPLTGSLLSSSRQLVAEFGTWERRPGPLGPPARGAAR